MGVMNIPLDKDFKGRVICTREEFEEFIKKHFQSHKEMMDRKEPPLHLIDVYTLTELGGGKLEVELERKVVVKGQHRFYGCPFTITYRPCYRCSYPCDTE